ncbi:MAG: glycosyltransferase family A protein [Acidimicrobiales bacterium]
MGRSDLLDLLAILDALGLLSLVYVNVPGGARLLFAVGFAAFVPGRAIVSNWPTLARWSEVAMSLVLSLVAVALVATVFLWAHAWHPLVLFQFEAWLSVVGLGLGAARRHELLPPQARVRASSRQRSASSDGTTAMCVGLVDLDGSEAIIGLDGSSLSDNERARLLVRMHRAPLGFVDVSAHPRRSLGRRTRAQAQTALEVAVQGHIACDAVAGDPMTSDLWFARAACPLEFPATGVDGLTIAVCTRDRTEPLGECLRALQKVNGDRLEILVVDNAPTEDKTRNLVMALGKRDPRIRYSCEHNPGLSNARNHALAVARFDHVAFTDDDVSVDPGWPNALAAGFALDPDVVCVTGLVASSTLGTVSDRHFDARLPWREAFVPRRYDLDDHRLPDALYPFNAGVFGSGANFAVRATAVEKIGGFDNRLGVGSPGRGGEDLDIFVRLLEAGGRICYLPSALVWRTHVSDPALLRGQIYDYGHGLGAYFAKHLGERDFRKALTRHGVSRVDSIFLRRQEASNEIDRRRPGVGIAFTETMGLISGALRYWWGSLGATRNTA